MTLQRTAKINIISVRNYLKDRIHKEVLQSRWPPKRVTVNARFYCLHLQQLLAPFLIIIIIMYMYLQLYHQFHRRAFRNHVQWLPAPFLQPSLSCLGLEHSTQMNHITLLPKTTGYTCIIFSVIMYHGSLRHCFNFYFGTSDWSIPHR